MFSQLVNRLGLESLRRWRVEALRRLAGSAHAPRQSLHSSARQRSNPSTLQSPGFLLPLARPNWLGAGLAWHTPERVETILRNGLAGDVAGAGQLFELMEDTWPRLSKNLQELKDAVVNLDWILQPCAPKGSPPSAEAHARARLVEEALWGMSPNPAADENGFEETIRDLLDARGKGISVLEIDWETRSQIRNPKPEIREKSEARNLNLRDSALGVLSDFDLRSSDFLIAPRATRWVHPRHYGFDAQGRLGLRVEGLAGLGLQPFPADKFLIGVLKSRTGHACGAAQLRVLAWWWAASSFSQEWFLNFAQIFGQPLRWATFDPNLNDADKATLEAALRGMGSNAWAMFPSGTQLELKEASSRGADNPQVLLQERADRLCDLLILRQSLTSEAASPGGGSRALGEVHERVLDGVKLALAGWVARILQQQLIKPILRQNFGDDRQAPWLAPSLKPSRDRRAVAEGLVASRAAGLRLPRNWAYEQVDIPQPQAGEDVIEPEEKRKT
jgi:phage gp29-like protein